VSISVDILVVEKHMQSPENPDNVNIIRYLIYSLKLRSSYCQDRLSALDFLVPNPALLFERSPYLWCRTWIQLEVATQYHLSQYVLLAWPSRSHSIRKWPTSCFISEELDHSREGYATENKNKTDGAAMHSIQFMVNAP